MPEKRIMVKVTPETRRALKLLAALAEEPQYAVLERLVLAELNRLESARSFASLGKEIS
jgi:hypothetical protein